MYEVDKRGLDRLDRSVLEALITKFGGGPVGLSTLAIAVGEEPETVETVAEPFLVREGLLGRTPRGRIAMAPAWTHLGLRSHRLGSSAQEPWTFSRPSRAMKQSSSGMGIQQPIAAPFQLFPLDWYDARHVRALFPVSRLRAWARPRPALPASGPGSPVQSGRR